MVNQHESPFYDEDATACQRAHKRIVESFPISRVYQAHIPTYPSGHWAVRLCLQKIPPAAGPAGGPLEPARPFLPNTTRPHCTRAHFICPLMLRSF